MTETEWITSTDPQEMLDFLMFRSHPDMPRFKTPSDRKLRLFACACCRQMWDSLTDGASRKAMLVAERYADREATIGELTNASLAILKAGDADWAAYPCTSTRQIFPALDTIWRNKPDHFPSPVIQASLIRDIVGNPLRPVEVASYVGHWHSGLYAAGGSLFMRDWLTPTVTSMAKAIYQDRTFDDMPILGDALEEAGCDNEDILRHCRGYEWCIDDCHDEAGGSYWCSLCGGTEGGTENWMPLRGPHVRGCWVLDLLTGRE